MNDAAALLEIEAIKQLKARYCRFLDAKDWTAWRGIFADDFLSDTAEAGGKVIRGADEFVAFTRKRLEKPSHATAHQVHAPEIELTSPTTARGCGRWRMWFGWRLGSTSAATAITHETYEKADGQWRMTSSKLTRLREDIFNTVVSVYISDRVRKVLMKAARRVVK